MGSRQVMAEMGGKPRQRGKKRPAPRSARAKATPREVKALQRPQSFSKLGGFLSTSSLLTFARVAGALAGFVTQVVLARTLQASALGLFYSVTATAAIVSLIAAGGYPAIAPRFMSRYRERGKDGLVAAFVARARRDATLYVAIATLLILALAWLWPGFSFEARLALAGAALSMPALASIRINGTFALVKRRFALCYLPDTCIRPFLLLAAIAVLVGLGVPLSAAEASWLLTFVVSILALGQYVLLGRIMPKSEGTPADAGRLAAVWQREAKPLILVALFTNFFGDVAILMVTPLMTSAETAALGLCLKLSLLVGFAVQVAHQVVVPDLADAHSRKDAASIGEVMRKALAFPLFATLAALAVVIVFGERILAIFGPEFSSASLPLVILMACQVFRAAFGPSVPLLTVVGAQRENAVLAVGGLAVLAIANVVLVPLYGVLGAAIAVVVATLAGSIGAAIVLARVSGLRTDAVHLIASARALRAAHA